jgi:hypothetical protein
MHLLEMKMSFLSVCADIKYSECLDFLIVSYRLAKGLDSMLTIYFKNPLTLAKYSSGIAGLYLDDLIGWLKNQSYSRTSIRRLTFKTLKKSLV